MNKQSCECFSAHKRVRCVVSSNTHSMSCFDINSIQPHLEPPRPHPIPSACVGAIDSLHTAQPGPSCSRGRGRCAPASGGRRRSWTAAGLTGRCSGGECRCRLGPMCQHSTPPSDSPHQTWETQMFSVLLLQYWRFSLLFTVFENSPDYKWSVRNLSWNTQLI